MPILAYIAQRGRRFTVQIIEERSGQPIDHHDATSIGDAAEWLAVYHPQARIAPATPACAIREDVA